MQTNFISATKIKTCFNLNTSNSFEKKNHSSRNNKIPGPQN